MTRKSCRAEKISPVSTNGIRRDNKWSPRGFHACTKSRQHTNRPCLSLCSEFTTLARALTPKRHVVHEFSGKWGVARFSPVQSSRSLNRGTWKTYRQSDRFRKKREMQCSIASDLVLTSRRNSRISASSCACFAFNPLLYSKSNATHNRRCPLLRKVSARAKRFPDGIGYQVSHRCKIASFARIPA